MSIIQETVDYPAFTGRIRHIGSAGYLPLQVTLAELDQQHQRGWVDYHPEDFCHRCGNRNISWAVEHRLWAGVMERGGGDPWHGIVCIPCFIELHEVVLGEATWHLAYDQNGTTILRKAHPSGYHGTAYQLTEDTDA